MKRERFSRGAADEVQKENYRARDRSVVHLFLRLPDIFERDQEEHYRHDTAFPDSCTDPFRHPLTSHSAKLQDTNCLYYTYRALHSCQHVFMNPLLEFGHKTLN